MSVVDFTYRIYHNQIIYLEWSAGIDIEKMHRIKHLTLQIQAQNLFQILDVVPAYHSLTIFLQHKYEQITEMMDLLIQLYNLPDEPVISSGKIWKIPVIYGGKYGPDLNEACAKLQVEPEILIEKHTFPIYDVFFMGFLPGFPYLGGLDTSLHLERKDIPSPTIMPGAVGIGGSQTGIYPVKSPGGWHIIGHTPFPLFELDRNPPIVIQSGDQIQFFSIGETEIEACMSHINSEIKEKYPNSEVCQN